MIVLDASIVVEILIGSARASMLLDVVEGNAGPAIAPHLLDAEVISTLRSLVAGQRLDSHRAEQMLDDFAALPLERYSLVPFARRIWELRHNFTAYDAAYIALAEGTGATLFTCDAKLRKGHRARVAVYPPARTQ